MCVTTKKMRGFCPNEERAVAKRWIAVRKGEQATDSIQRPTLGFKPGYERERESELFDRTRTKLMRIRGCPFEAIWSDLIAV